MLKFKLSNDELVDARVFAIKLLATNDREKRKKWMDMLSDDSPMMKLGAGKIRTFIREIALPAYADSWEQLENVNNPYPNISKNNIVMQLKENGFTANDYEIKYFNSDEAKELVKFYYDGKRPSVVSWQNLENDIIW